VKVDSGSLMPQRRRDAETQRGDDELSDLTAAVIGAAMEVHRELGPGYLESTYEVALSEELKIRGVPFLRQIAFEVCYKGIVVGEQRLDFLIDSKLVVELKAVEGLAEIHRAQVISYLKLANRRLGLLINFNVPVLRLGIRRVINPEWKPT